jgi:hypothetical protein
VTWTNGGIANAAANKNVVYHGRDCVATIGYTGLARLEGTPTDTWLAKLILGYEPEGMRIGAVATVRVLRLREVVHRITDSLAAAFATRERRYRSMQHAFVIGGWRFNPRNGAFWPFSISIEKPAGAGDVRVAHHLSRRRWRWGEYSITAVGTHPLNGHEIETLRLSVSAALRDPQQVAELLAEATRLAASRSDRVGPHCMTSVIPAPRGRFDVAVRLRTDPAAPQPPLYYMPWIIMGDSLAVRPSTMWTRDITDQPGLVFTERHATVTTYQ